MQHIPTVSEDDVRRIVNRDYPSASREQILQLIEALVVPEKPRVALACLKIGGGNLDRVQKELNEAPGYWREIISAAEYPLATKRWGRLRNQSDAARQKVYDADWMQYTDWLNKTQ